MVKILKVAYELPMSWRPLPRLPRKVRSGGILGSWLWKGVGKLSASSCLDS